MEEIQSREEALSITRPSVDDTKSLPDLVFPSAIGKRLKPRLCSATILLHDGRNSRSRKEHPTGVIKGMNESPTDC